MRTIAVYSFWLALPAIAAMAYLLPADAVGAQVAKKSSPTLSDAQLAESIYTLRNVRHTLEMADHDYGGHRAAAVRDITAAVHQLRKALDHVHKGKAVPKGEKKKGPANREPQALSDAQLAAAVPALTQVASLLKTSSHDYGGHRAQAVTDLEAAVRQLDKALKYSQEKNQDKP
jgi:hypothetical protein